MKKFFDKILSFANTLARDYYGKENKRPAKPKMKTPSRVGSEGIDTYGTGV